MNLHAVFVEKRTNVSSERLDGVLDGADSSDPEDREEGAALGLFCSLHLRSAPATLATSPDFQDLKIHCLTLIALSLQCAVYYYYEVRVFISDTSHGPRLPRVDQERNDVGPVSADVIGLVREPAFAKN